MNVGRFLVCLRAIFRVTTVVCNEASGVALSLPRIKRLLEVAMPISIFVKALVEEVNFFESDWLLGVI